ncbi:hypothetical protein AAFF_G00030200 [Aldrovandia affinis]|uniref:Uncharacterized protein n=1 Tax=Aldrovandia affinis TaxID=143900 RepID=A0AAD7S3X8_9TELE|nr:hypothetical protein AAFF_G00030200 [Aldrovandia affinis]
MSPLSWPTCLWSGMTVAGGGFPRPERMGGSVLLIPPAMQWPERQRGRRLGDQGELWKRRDAGLDNGRFRARSMSPPPLGPEGAPEPIL